MSEFAEGLVLTQEPTSSIPSFAGRDAREFLPTVPSRQTVPLLTVKNVTVFRPKVEIMGIPFDVEQLGTEYVLRADRFSSLRAAGPTIREAIAEMRDLLSFAVEEYVLCSESELTEDAKELRHFLINSLI